ncbi:hypothetical protein F5B19DRAFT_20386 [Rostrohypoxylon terebratum]|nr:hypothetical protein F5B19DRAFT_20386 [Rostrohypoxylon terebratum]
MTTVLGKRKVRSHKKESSITQEDAQEIFRRHFEAQFAPLESTQPTLKTTQASELEDLRSDSEDASDDSWDGVSGSDEDEELGSSSPSTSVAEVVEVVSHTKDLPALSNDPLSKRESKAYLSSRIPSSSLDPSLSSKPTSTTKRKTTADEDAPSLLKNDLALQRLLSESHLFSGPGHNDGSIEHAGRNRHKATDIRMSALGSKTSIYKQVKMPMSHRKGIAAAATARESKRRREARENGIILERPTSGSGKGNVKMRKRERVVDAPAVGKLRNGMLKLSRKDITEIQGSEKRSGGKSGGKRRRR